ncbi:hypothetical protein JCM9492_16820 [Aquifex pyrophilus]
MERKEISQETINTLIELMKGVVGEGGVNTVMKKLEGNLSGRELVYTFAEEMMKLYGDKGSYAIIGQAYAGVFFTTYSHQTVLSPWSTRFAGADGDLLRASSGS